MHTYDYPTPRNSPAAFLGVPAVGPWFWPRFQTLGVADRNLRVAITDYVLNQLADTLLGLARRFANVTVVMRKNGFDQIEKVPGSGKVYQDWDGR